MMTCRQIENELSAYLDGELAASRHAEVQAHLGGCERCRQRLAELERLSDGVARLPQLEPPPGFVPDLFRRLRAGEEPRRSWVDVVFRPLWLKLPVEAVAVVAVAVGVMFMAQHEQKPQQCVPLYPATIETQPAPAPVAPETRKNLEGEMAKLSEKPADKGMPAAAAPAPEPTGPRPYQALDRADLPTAEAKRAGREQARGYSDAMSGGAANQALAFKKDAADKQQRGAEVVVLANANPSVVEQRVAALVKEMGGKLLEPKPAPTAARSIRVSVPTAMVAEFKAQLAEAKGERQRRMVALSAAAKGKATAEKAKEEPMTELEIRIVAPVKK
jgi:anti-sigma factor RsiW